MPWNISENVFAWHLKEHILESKQTSTYVSNLTKKLAIEDKTKPLGFQKVRLENEQPEVIWLKYLIVPSKTRKCQSQHVLLYS